GSTPAMIENEIASGISAITETAQSYGSRIHHDKRKNQFAIVTGTSRIAQLAAWALATQTRNLQLGNAEGVSAWHKSSRPAPRGEAGTDRDCVVSECQNSSTP
ncbi:MAG: hypothetical protein KDB72_02615, partial [Mycobacterium sp.]|nr:hypothetical protein [Mycobacterium sp.]